MTRKELTESEESEAQERASSDEDEEHEDRTQGQEQPQQGMTEYEKQRLSRIAENRARMEALGLTKMASSLFTSSRDSGKRKEKTKVVEEDEDYTPNYHDERADDDDEFLGKKSSGARKTKGKNKGSKTKKVSAQMGLSGSDYVEDDDELMKAIALSLQDSAGASCLTPNERKRNGEDTGRQKRKKSFTSRVQMTEDELVIHFCQFDEAGKGSITVRDLQKIALAHDFIWTDEELADMIHCFDGDGDGKLNLDDFQKIVSGCNMLIGSETSC